MPNAGAAETYVVSKVAEAAQHPKALLFGAIAAMTSSPTASATMADQLGLAKDEAQFARWLAVFRRGKSRADFLKGLLEILQNQEKQEREMETRKGSGFFHQKLTKLASEVFGAELRIPYLRPESGPWIWDFGTTLELFRAKEQGEEKLIEVRSFAGYLASDDGIVEHVRVRVYDRSAMPAASRLARRLETLTRRIQPKSSEVHVYQDYA